MWLALTRASFDEAGSPVDGPQHAEERRGYHEEKYPVEHQYDDAGSYSLASDGSAGEEHFVCEVPLVFCQRQATWGLINNDKFTYEQRYA